MILHIDLTTNIDSAGIPLAVPNQLRCSHLQSTPLAEILKLFPNTLPQRMQIGFGISIQVNTVAFDGCEPGSDLQRFPRGDTFLKKSIRDL